MADQSMILGPIAAFPSKHFPSPTEASHQLAGTLKEEEVPSDAPGKEELVMEAGTPTSDLALSSPKLPVWPFEEGMPSLGAQPFALVRYAPHH